jgi:hypothetical protein
VKKDFSTAAVVDGTVTTTTTRSKLLRSQNLKGFLHTQGYFMNCFAI